MNDYCEILPFLKRELEQLESKKLQLSVESLLEVLSHEGSDLADAAVREYTRTLIWPRVSDEVQFELCLRLRVAIWWIESLNDTSTEDESLKEFLIGTMIEYWRDVGRTDWIWNHFVNQDVAI
jgi:hypothetical protein